MKKEHISLRSRRSQSIAGNAMVDVRLFKKKSPYPDQLSSEFDSVINTRL
jgi:hypothetical protein